MAVKEKRGVVSVFEPTMDRLLETTMDKFTAEKACKLLGELFDGVHFLDKEVHFPRRVIMAWNRDGSHVSCKTWDKWDATARGIIKALQS